MAMQGMVVVPIFAGFDLTRGEGRLYEFDVTAAATKRPTMRRPVRAASTPAPS